MLLRVKLFFLLGFFLPFGIGASIYDYYPKKLEPSSTSYGITGVIQMPNARLMKEGSMKIGYSSSYPYEYTYISATPFPWMEAVYKYTELKNQLYGPQSYSGNQTLKDKGFDLKINLLRESYYFPTISIGWNDLAGTGKFASEYLSATKLFGNTDFTVGIAWGALGQDNNIKNPLIDAHEQFRNRQKDVGLGGTFNNKSWFSGENAAIFSAIEYYSWKQGLVYKVEYDTSNPDISFSGPPIKVNSRFNVGVQRPINESLDVGLSFERGNQWRLSFSIKSDYGKRALVKKNDPPKNVLRLNNSQLDSIAKDKRVFYRSLNKSLREESILIQSAELKDDEVEVVIAQNRFRSFPRAIGRTARIASALTPPEVKNIRVIPMNGDLEIYAAEFSKKDFENFDDYKITKNELLNRAQFNAVDPGNYLGNDFLPNVRFPEVFFNMSPSLRHQIGGPEAFYLGQLWWKINTKVKFNRGFTFHTTLGINIYNNFDEFNNPSYSEIPHVRSDLQEYLSQGENNIARLKLDYIWSPYKDFFARLDLGYLEEMFGGFGGEIFYRPFNKNFSTSLQLHAVKQRDFNQRLGFRKYKTETGHLGFYYDFPRGLNAQLLVGKYLAGDKGATLDLSKRFNNGFTLGIFATKTDLSDEEFGEGSFDKGFYFSIPTDSFFTKYRQGDISFGLRPLTKDGGAILNHLNPLYSLYGDTKLNSILRDWKDLNE